MTRRTGATGWSTARRRIAMIAIVAGAGLLTAALGACTPHVHADGRADGARSHVSESTRNGTGQSVPPVRAAAPSPPSSPFDRDAHSTSDPSSIWVVVNKTHPISPLHFRPRTSLVRGYRVATPAAGPLTRLLRAGDRRGLGLKIASAFRSYEYQSGVHRSLAAAQGPAAADRISARPGYSEHQTGLAVDLVTPADPGCDLEACFADTTAGRWLRRSAWKFGFIVRYLPGNEAVTGYSPEPWHLRYVGRALAAELHRQGVTTLEEFFDLGGGDYPAGAG